jgi:hypothetical protein
MDDNVGGALAGPLDPATATNQWDSWLDRPGNRTALLQMGLQLMQPVGIGQTAGGAIAQSVGAGGEAIDRQEAADLKDTIAQNKLDTANSRLQIAQQNADSNATRATAAATAATTRKIGGLTDVIKARFAREDQKAFEKRLDDDSKSVEKRANDLLADPNDPVVQEYKGMSRMQIRDKLRQGRPVPKAAGTMVDDTNDDTTDTTDTSAPSDTPPMSGAKKAPDGNWYVPDPKRQGKFLLVR